MRSIYVVSVVFEVERNGATGSDVTGSGHHRNRSDCEHVRSRKLRNIRPSGAFSPEVTSSNVKWPRSSLGRVGYAHAQPEVGDFSLLASLLTGNDVIKLHVIPYAFPWKIWQRACTTGSALGMLSRTSASYILIIFHELALSLVFSSFLATLLSWGAPWIITQPWITVFNFTFLCVLPPRADWTIT